MLHDIADLFRTVRNTVSNSNWINKRTDLGCRHPAVLNHANFDVRLRTHAPYVRTCQVELPHGICSLFNHVDYLFPRITCISRIWLHTEITEITELRFALLSLHPDGKFTLIIFA